MAKPPEIQFIDSFNPSECIFRVPYLSSEIRPWNVPAIGTPYKECRILANANVLLDGCGEYTYRHKTVDGNWMWFYFVKHKTEAEKKVPFETEWTSKLWKWPNVLNSLIFVPDNAFPLSTNYPIPPNPNGSSPTTGGLGLAFSPNLIERMNLTPETLALSVCKIEKFTSDSDWGAAALTHPQPTEGYVSWDFNGAKGSITCLHPDIRLPARGKAYTTVVNATVTSAEAAPFVPERIFPATNFENWEPFVISDDVVQQNGEYRRERVTIFPPEQNEPSIV